MQIPDFVSKMGGNINRYDLRYLTSEYFNSKETLADYLNQPDVIAHLHATKTKNEVKYTVLNHTVYNNFYLDAFNSTEATFTYLLDNNVDVFLYAGNMDMVDGPYGIQEWMKKLKWSHMTEFFDSSRNLYYYTENGEPKVGGNYKQFKNLHLLMIYDAGHLVPSTQMAVSRTMLSDMINHNELQCHHPHDECNLDKVT